MQSVRKRLESWKAIQGVLFVAVIIVGLQRFPYQGLVVIGLFIAFYIAFSIYMDTRCASCGKHVLPTTGWETRKAGRSPDRCPHCSTDLRRASV
ncbi:hypothetical protein [Vitreimonas flagellata]|uniref:hypothetical protein n=1 Tax=Vitreimonas flagellata TaxID=2560861 RepID=UPI001074F8D4|nr:hypothetical protein [Vitreimonas flagellata]